MQNNDKTGQEQGNTKWLTFDMPKDEGCLIYTGCNYNAKAQKKTRATEIKKQKYQNNEQQATEASSSKVMGG